MSDSPSGTQASTPPPEGVQSGGPEQKTHSFVLLRRPGPAPCLSFPVLAAGAPPSPALAPRLWNSEPLEVEVTRELWPWRACLPVFRAKNRKVLRRPAGLPLHDPGLPGFVTQRTPGSHVCTDTALLPQGFPSPAPPLLRSLPWLPVTLDPGPAAACHARPPI